MKQLLLFMLVMSNTFLSLAQTSSEKSSIDLPKELWGIIASFLTSSESSKKAVENIKALAKVNKTINQYLSNPINLNELINKIARQFNTNRIIVESFFGTETAKKWLDSVLKKFQEDESSRPEIIKSAINTNNVPLLAYLYNHGVNLNDVLIKKRDGIHSPFELALDQLKADAVAFLVEKKLVDVNHIDSNWRIKETPLMRAINNQKSWPVDNALKIVQILLENGAVISEEVLSNIKDNPKMLEMIRSYANKALNTN